MEGHFFDGRREGILPMEDVWRAIVVKNRRRIKNNFEKTDDRAKDLC